MAAELAETDGIGVLATPGEASGRAMPQLFVLFENASGYGLFEAVEFDDMSALGSQVAKTVDDMSRFGKVVKLTAFQVSC